MPSASSSARNATGAAGEGLEQRLHLARLSRLVERHADEPSAKRAQVEALAGARAPSTAVARGGRRSAPCSVSKKGARAGVEPSRRSPSCSSARRACGRGGRSARGPPARGRRRTSRPSPPAAPAPCRCCSWPSRGGCAARASAARAGRPCGPRRPSRRRPGGPAGGACAPRAPRRRPRAARRSPSARRSAAPSRARRRRPSRRAGVSSVSASRSVADDHERARGVGALAERSRSRRARRRSPGTATSTPNSPLGREVDRVERPDVDLDPERLGARLDDGDRLRVAVLGDEEAVAGPASPTARHSVIASAAAVASSSSDAFASGSAVRSATIVWKLRSASSRPCAISAWYGRVLRVPARVLEHVALDHRRRVAVGVAHADERAEAAGCATPCARARRAPAPR